MSKLTPKFVHDVLDYNENLDFVYYIIREFERLFPQISMDTKIEKVDWYTQQFAVPNSTELVSKPKEVLTKKSGLWAKFWGFFNNHRAYQRTYDFGPTFANYATYELEMTGYACQWQNWGQIGYITIYMCYNPINDTLYIKDYQVNVVDKF
jgi:hypothetical protein